MKKKSIEEIMKKFYEEYQDHPEGWSFWVSPPPSSDDFYEAYMIHGDEAFFLKLDSIYTPKPAGVGTKVMIERDQLVEDLPDFGFRKFSKEEARDFLERLPKPEDYESKEKFWKDLKNSREEIVEEALDKKPVPFKNLEEPGEMAALGPYSSRSPLSYVSEKQEELREKLSRELERIVSRDYPGHY